MKKILLITFMGALITLQAGAQWTCGQDITDSRDGKVYKTKLIGTQCWTTENMNLGTKINSMAMGYLMTDNGVVEKYCWNDSIENCDGTGGLMKRGGFYEWKEAMQYYSGQPTLPVQGVCPAGWHIPSNTEWNTLLNYLGGNMAYQQMIVGGSSGFNSLMTGYRCTMTGGFRVSAMSADYRAYYWTSEQYDTDNSPLLEIATTGIFSMNFYKSLGLSVRCVKDVSTSIDNQVLPEMGINYVLPSEDASIEIFYNKARSGQVLCTVISTSGKVVYRSVWASVTGNNVSKISSVSFSPGIYVIRLSDGYTTVDKRFLIP
jgi:uncharacterized protein (TIGR02145 family)